MKKALQVGLSESSKANPGFKRAKSHTLISPRAVWRSKTGVRFRYDARDGKSLDQEHPPCVHKHHKSEHTHGQAFSPACLLVTDS